MTLIQIYHYQITDENNKQVPYIDDTDLDEDRQSEKSAPTHKTNRVKFILYYIKCMHNS